MHFRTVLLSGAVLAVFTYFSMKRQFGKLVRDLTPLFVIVALFYLLYQLLNYPALAEWAFRGQR